MVRLSSVVLACVASLSLSGLAGAQPLSGDPFQKLTLVEKSETTTSTFTVDATGQARYTLKGPKPISETGKLSTAELAELVRDYDRSDFMTLPSDVTQVKHIMAPKVTFALWSETASDRKRIRGEPTIFTASALRVMALVTFLEKLQARIASGAAQSSFDVLTLVEKRDTTATFTVDAVGNARYKLAGPKPAAASGKLTAAELAALVQAYDDADFATLPADVTQVMHVMAPQVTFTLESDSTAGKKTIHGEPGIFAASAARAKPLVALLEKHRARIAASLPAPLAPTAGLTGAVGGTR